MPLLLLLTGHIAVSFAQTQMPALKNYIQYKSSIAEGGTEIFEYEGTTYIISVVQVIVSSKSELQCKTVGGAKAKKDMLAYVNGSDITSLTLLINSEIATDGIEGQTVECKQEYIESIRENVMGNISQVTPLVGWYSPDKSVYYYSAYKIL